MESIRHDEVILTSGCQHIVNLRYLRVPNDCHEKLKVIDRIIIQNEVA